MQPEEKGEGGEVIGLQAVDAEGFVELVPGYRADVGLYAGEDELHLFAGLVEYGFSVRDGEIDVIVDALAGVEDEGELEDQGEE